MRYPHRLFPLPDNILTIGTMLTTPRPMAPAEQPPPLSPSAAPAQPPTRKRPSPTGSSAAASIDVDAPPPPKHATPRPSPRPQPSTTSPRPQLPTTSPRQPPPPPTTYQEPMVPASLERALDRSLDSARSRTSDPSPAPAMQSELDPSAFYRSYRHLPCTAKRPSTMARLPDSALLQPQPPSTPSPAATPTPPKLVVYGPSELTCDILVRSRQQMPHTEVRLEPFALPTFPQLVNPPPLARIPSQGDL